MPGGRGAATGTRRAPQEGDQEETGEPGLAGGEPPPADLTHGRPDCAPMIYRLSLNRRIP